MKITSVVMAFLFACGMAVATDTPNVSQPTFANNKELLLPANYRSWVALAPTTAGMPASHHREDVVRKVYVEPTAYEGFLKRGVWPNHTVIVLELRDKATPPKTICDGIIGFEVAAKDEANLAEPWSYYGILYDHDKAKPKTIEAKKDCANCAAESTDMRLAMYFPALRAVIHAKPQTMQPSAF